MASIAGHRRPGADAAHACEAEPDPAADNHHKTPLRLTSEQAFDTFAESIHRFVVVRLGGDGHAADDVMQRLWLCVRGRPERLPRDEAERWLRAVARNLVNEFWRREGGRPDRPMADTAVSALLADRIDTSPLPPEMLEKREVHEQLLLALTELPADDQRVLIARYFHSHTLAQIAEAELATERAIEGRLYRARSRLKRMLHALAEDDGESS